MTDQARRCPKILFECWYGDRMRIALHQQHDIRAAEFRFLNQQDEQVRFARAAFRVLIVVPVASVICVLAEAQHATGMRPRT